MVTNKSAADLQSEVVLLIRALQSRGLALQAAGETLLIRPPGQLTEAERAAVTRLKREILATLPQNGTNETNGTTAQTAGGVDGVARRLWAWLLGTEPTTARMAADDLAQVASDPAIDAAAAELRQALLALSGAPTWPPEPQALGSVLDRLVSAGVLLRDENQRLRPLTEGA